MPPDTLAPLILFSLLVVTAGGVLILRGPLGKALAERVAGRSLSEGEERVERLDRDVQEMRAELGDLHERLEFAERMLAQQRDRPAVAEGADASVRRSR